MPDLVAVWWVAFILATVLRAAAAAWLPLQGTEAYYWVWSLHPALGYYDHPPLLAWSIRAATAVMGPTALAVRLPSLVGTTAATVSVWALGRRLGGSARAGARAGLVSLCVPYMSMLAVVAFPDGPMLGLCAAAMALAWRRRWDASGGFLGLGLLTKFTAALVGMATILWRRSARDLWRWAVIAAVVAAPFMFWEARHGWITFRFQLLQRPTRETELDPGRFLEFLGLEGLTASPILLACLVAAVWMARRERSERGRFLCWHAAFPMAPFVVFSFFHKVEPQWPFVAYLAAFVALGVACESSSRLRRATGVGLALGAAMTLAMLSAAYFPQLLFTVKHDPSGSSATEVYAMPALGARLRATPGLLLTQDHGLTSALQFYSGRSVHWFSYQLHGREFLEWEDYAALRGQDGVFVEVHNPAEDCEIRWLLAQAFEQVGKPETVTIYWHGQVARIFDLWPGRRFRGRAPDYRLTPPAVP